MADVPLILVVGGDALAVRVCEELCSTQGHRVALVWPHDQELAKQLERIKCEYLPFAPNDYDSLRSVGVPDARFGERVVALVVAREGRAIDPAAVRQDARGHLAGYKVPREIVVTDEIVRSPSGKPDYVWARSVADSAVRP